ncbi:elongation factor P hydroxylase [Gallaecimonas sp. GXIMD4217]|uniref:elongation factor P hydroxylase n=1 Tax=Gallaecimonas sp. GXIMD4217 TaxID=3131927 RepID=UPI00311B4165
MKHSYQDLIRLFDHCFFESHNTRLIKGGDEPIYLPAGQGVDHHQVVFAHGYFASALHEVAHWCIAGAKRRQLEDYGYWYCPDGRDAEQQARFEKVEIKPQALEWAFSAAAGFRFRVSTDNLNGAEPDRIGFTNKVREQALTYLEQGFPARAAAFIDALCSHYRTGPLTAEHFPKETP